MKRGTQKALWTHIQHRLQKEFEEKQALIAKKRATSGYFNMDELSKKERDLLEVKQQRKLDVLGVINECILDLYTNQMHVDVEKQEEEGFNEKFIDGVKLTLSQLKEQKDQKWVRGIMMNLINIDTLENQVKDFSNQVGLMDPIEYRLRKSKNDFNIYGDEYKEYTLEKRHGQATLQKYKEILNLVPFRDVNTAKYENFERDLRERSVKDYHDFAKRLTKYEKPYNPYRIKKFTL